MRCAECHLINLSVMILGFMCIMIFPAQEWFTVRRMESSVMNRTIVMGCLGVMVPRGMRTALFGRKWVTTPAHFMERKPNGIVMVASRLSRYMNSESCLHGDKEMKR